MNSLQKTTLYDACVKAGGVMVDFHGWLLPIRFEGIIAEHDAVRNRAGVFDVSHMGEIFVKGKDAHKFVQSVATNNFKKVKGAGSYSHVLDFKGGVIDDVIGYCLSGEEFLIIVNSATTEKDYKWFLERAKDFDVEVVNKSAHYAMVALQGPHALKLIEGLDKDISSLPRFNIKQTILFNSPAYITRTGYTGEDGVEILADANTILKVWDYCLQNGARPCGLGARDVLRLEAGYLLSGSDMDERRTPYEANCGWVVKLGKEEDFPGKAFMKEQKEKGVKEKWTGFKISGGVARAGAEIFKDGKKIGALTSATYSPLFKCIGAGYAPADLVAGDKVEIDVRGRRLPAEVAKMPFYKIL
jgi:aminomethyltransferase